MQIDLLSNLTTVYDANCDQHLDGFEKSCRSAPTFVISDFTSNDLKNPNFTLVDRMSEVRHGGQIVSGDVIKGQVCPIDSLENKKCAKMEFLDVREIDQDYWNTEQTTTGSNGTLGLVHFE